MSAFERLDPLVQHHIVNTLGWRELRPLQEASIGPVLEGHNCLLLAPTAGGKTESAMFPLLSRMCAEHWTAPSILYICPLKALINNLGERLDRYTRMLGRTAAVWHGDIGQSDRNQVRKEPADVLLTTPESLEAMLISSNPGMRSQLERIQTVVVDEIHAFAGDDRGWHLLCVLQRLQELAGKEFQRIGLSATVGNPKELLDWLVAGGGRSKSVVQPEFPAAGTAEVVLDYVGNLENAAVVISRLHRGEKRLVFCDSRSRVEQLATLLRSFSVQVVVSHSSLSAAERRRAEEVFARGDDCVIVATSTLELGIDVGDLDRVIQIDAPTRVASFLQRLGRTGRRAGKPRNCLFLCTSEDALLQAAGLLELWSRGYVEPITPPPLPYHIVAQQALALCLQYGGVPRDDLQRRLASLPPAHCMDSETVGSILDHLSQTGMVASDGARWFIAEKAETTFGRRNFLELVSVFTSAPVLAVTDGPHELGFVDQSLFTTRNQGDERLLSLGGRGWRVVHVDWKERRVSVVPSEVAGKMVWLGTTRGLSFVLCRAIHNLLLSEGEAPHWSQRAKERLGAVRQEFSFLESEGIRLVAGPDGKSSWYTFGGDAVNSAIAAALNAQSFTVEGTDEFAITFSRAVDTIDLCKCIRALRPADATAFITLEAEARSALKFADCVPDDLLLQQIRARYCDPREVEAILGGVPGTLQQTETKR